jgi:hypothetical protein
MYKITYVKGELAEPALKKIHDLYQPLPTYYVLSLVYLILRKKKELRW